MTRWIGFDMDECIGSVMPLYSFVSIIPKITNDDNVTIALMQTLFHSELENRTWLIRPALLESLELVHRAYVKKQIYGAFILSNNGSKELVNFVASFLNFCMWKLYDNKGPHSLIFKMTACANTPARKPYDLEKNFRVVQLCLAAEGLPLCSSENDLLFFDDLLFPMNDEIKYYVQVPAYLFQTEVNEFLNALQPMKKYFSESEWHSMVQYNRELNKRDFQRPHNTYKPYRQSLDEIMRDRMIFSNAIETFVTKEKQGRKNRLYL